jgi:hypothetical protein
MAETTFEMANNVQFGREQSAATRPTSASARLNIRPREDARRKRARGLPVPRRRPLAPRTSFATDVEQATTAVRQIDIVMGRAINGPSGIDRFSFKQKFPVFPVLWIRLGRICPNGSLMSRRMFRPSQPRDSEYAGSPAP